VERAHTRRWASKASWRLTFTVWSAVLVLWAVVTILIDYNTLLFIRKIVGEHGRAPIVVLAVVIVLPMLVDAVRNASRHRSVRRSQAWRDDPTSSWRQAVPAMTPRRFRSRDDAEANLTWRERAIVEQGQLAYGSVLHHGALSSVRYVASWGDEVASRPVAAAEPRPREGSRAPLLFEPGAHVGVAPTLLRLEFRVGESHDTRPALEARSTVSGPDALSLPLVATLHPVERMSRYVTTNVGELELADGQLTLTPASGDPTSIRLDKPFRVEASVFLLADNRAELNLLLEPRTHTAYRAGEIVPISFKSELAQERIDHRLPQAWKDVCYLEPKDFDALWSAIVSFDDDSTSTSCVSVAGARSSRR
jgi:hypothetical protein